MSSTKQRPRILTDSAMSQTTYPEPIHFLSFHKIVNVLDGREQTLDDPDIQRRRAAPTTLPSADQEKGVVCRPR